MKPNRQPSALFISKEGLSTFWFLLAAGAILGSILFAHNLLKKTALRPQFLIIAHSDVTTMRPEIDPEREGETATVMTRLAMDSVFNKSANGLDAPDRCKQILSPVAWKWVQSELMDKQNDAFRDSRMHQKVEIESIELHPQETDNAVLASARGQLIRTGVLDGKLFNEVWAVRAEFMWTHNPSLRLSGRYPMICSAFSCRETPVASTLRRAVSVDEATPDSSQTQPTPASQPPAEEGGPENQP